jgi:prepilin-type N-terminal cleavage/methylation domain-containing protein
VKKSANHPVSKRGFTLVEILVVITVIGILASLVMLTIIPNWRQRTYRNRAFAEVNTMANAARLYLDKYNVWPDDVDRDLPAELNEFIDVDEDWPDAPWPGSTYDWDNWTIGGDSVIQISIRFCPIGGPLSACNFPQEPWASNFGINSSVFYCLKDTAANPCRSHVSNPADYPGYCINCADKEIP